MRLVKKPALIRLKCLVKTPALIRLKRLVKTPALARKGVPSLASASLETLVGLEANACYQGSY